MMYKVVLCSVLTWVVFFASPPLAGMAQNFLDKEQIVIHNKKNFDPRLDNTPSKTDFDVGPNPGQTLNNHFFPGCIAYKNGYYKRAVQEFLFFIRYPHLTQMNPRHAEYHSSANYLLGMIYFYHASGRGKLALAKKHFEDAIAWNPKNYISYLELSRVLSSVALNDKAIAVLQKLLALQPDPEITLEAKKELSSVQAQRPN